MIIAAIFFQGGKELAFVPEELISRKLINYALRNPPEPEEFVQYVPKVYQDNEFWNTLVCKNGSALGLLDSENRSAELCIIAMQHSIENIKYIPKEYKVKNSFQI